VLREGVRVASVGEAGKEGVPVGLLLGQDIG
jgi:hypothetical protein